MFESVIIFKCSFHVDEFPFLFLPHWFPQYWDFTWLKMVLILLGGFWIILPQLCLKIRLFLLWDQ